MFLLFSFWHYGTPASYDGLFRDIAEPNLVHWAVLLHPRAFRAAPAPPLYTLLGPLGSIRGYPRARNVYSSWNNPAMAFRAEDAERCLSPNENMQMQWRQGVAVAQHRIGWQG